MRGLADRERGMRRERGTKGGAGAETRSGAGMGCVGTGGGGARGRKREKRKLGRNCGRCLGDVRGKEKKRKEF